MVPGEFSNQLFGPYLLRLQGTVNELKSLSCSKNVTVAATQIERRIYTS